MQRERGSLSRGGGDLSKAAITHSWGGVKKKKLGSQERKEAAAAVEGRENKTEEERERYKRRKAGLLVRSRNDMGWNLLQFIRPKTPRRAIAFYWSTGQQRFRKEGKTRTVCSEQTRSTGDTPKKSGGNRRLRVNQTVLQ